MKKILGIIFFTSMIGGAASIASANLITNGSFETGVTPPTGSFETLNSVNTDIDAWTVTNGNVDWINNYWNASDGTKSLDMAGNEPGIIQSDFFATDLGATYSVTFDMAANFAGAQNTTLELAAGYIIPDEGTYVSYFSFTRNGQTATNMQWQTMSYQFVATTSNAALIFGPPDYTDWVNNWSYYGPALDNVIVEKVGGQETSVPEPATMLLFGTGLAGLAGSRLRRKKK